MDHKQSLDYRYLGYDKCKDLGQKKYDYAKEGILTKLLPRILFKGNPTIVTFLQLIDMQLISMFKSVESMQKYKYITNY